MPARLTIGLPLTGHSLTGVPQHRVAGVRAVRASRDHLVRAVEAEHRPTTVPIAACGLARSGFPIRAHDIGHFTEVSDLNRQPRLSGQQGTDSARVGPRNAYVITRTSSA